MSSEAKQLKITTEDNMFEHKKKNYSTTTLELLNKIKEAGTIRAAEPMKLFKMILDEKKELVKEKKETFSEIKKTITAAFPIIICLCLAIFLKAFLSFVVAGGLTNPLSECLFLMLVTCWTAILFYIYISY